MWHFCFFTFPSWRQIFMIQRGTRMSVTTSQWNSYVKLNTDITCNTRHVHDCSSTIISHNALQVFAGKRAISRCTRKIRSTLSCRHQQIYYRWCILNHNLYLRHKSTRDSISENLFLLGFVISIICRASQFHDENLETTAVVRVKPDQHTKESDGESFLGVLVLEVMVSTFCGLRIRDWW